jgi:hypothetical protein
MIKVNNSFVPNTLKMLMTSHISIKPLGIAIYWEKPLLLSEKPSLPKGAHSFQSASYKPPSRWGVTFSPAVQHFT